MKAGGEISARASRTMSSLDADKYNVLAANALPDMNRYLARMGITLL